MPFQRESGSVAASGWREAFARCHLPLGYTSGAKVSGDLNARQCALGGGTFQQHSPRAALRQAAGVPDPWRPEVPPQHFSSADSREGWEEGVVPVMGGPDVCLTRGTAFFLNKGKG